MTKREMLELAAKAAGYEVKWRDKPYEPNFRKRELFGWDIWDPLSSYSDRYQLARDAKLMIDFETGLVLVPLELCTDQFKFTPGDHDAEAAAIIHAAAKIGELMK